MSLWSFIIMSSIIFQRNNISWRSTLKLNEIYINILLMVKQNFKSVVWRLFLARFLTSFMYNKLPSWEKNSSHIQSCLARSFSSTKPRGRPNKNHHHPLPRTLSYYTKWVSRTTSKLVRDIDSLSYITATRRTNDRYNK